MIRRWSLMATFAVHIAGASLATGLAWAPAPAAARAPARAPARSAAHPVSGLSVVALTIRHAGRHAGRPLVFRVELARTPAEQQQGLMFRKAMAPDEGMIFPMQPPRTAAFWMHNTVLPLDLVFIGPDGRILSIARGEPFSDAQIMSGGIVEAVLELNAGTAAALRIAAGDKVVW